MTQAKSVTDFRPDIEGLRALAMLAILVYHLDVNALTGGFSAVDIFFPISGYLISKQIIEVKQFSFIGFYRRRLRRIFFALVVTVLGSMIAGWILFAPADYASLAKSAICSVLAVANVYFYASHSYFDAESSLKPLLHVWSLSVEEQFYFIWPALLIGCLRFRLSLRWAILAIFAASLIASYVVTRIDPDFAFYMMFFRAFEFAIGALVLLMSGLRLTMVQRQICGAAGLGLIVLSLVWFDSTTVWPGANSLVPSLGAAAMIMAGPDAIPNRLLGNAGLVLIGRRTYSIYLVHWPLIVFYRYWTMVPLSLLEMVGLYIGSLALGALMFALIEKPFRYGLPPDSFIQKLWPQASAAMASLIVIVPAVTLVFATSVAVAKGVPGRLKIVQQPGELSFAGDICDSRRSWCSFGDLASSRIVYVMGDSHALNLLSGLDELFKRQQIKGIALFDHGCLFLYGTRAYFKGVPDKGCERNVSAAYRQIASDRWPVIIAGAYGSYTHGIGAAAGEVYDGVGVDYMAWIRQRFADSLRKIHANERVVIVLKQTYDAGVDPPRCLARPQTTAAACAPRSLAKSREANGSVDAMVESLRKEAPNLIILDPKSAFCSDENCTVKIGDELLFRDSVHLTYAGSRYLIGRLEQPLLAALLAALNGSRAAAH
ncbi:MAG: acyltransferase family protein [Rhodoplanes sp.]